MLSDMGYGLRVAWGECSFVFFMKFTSLQM